MSFAEFSKDLSLVKHLVWPHRSGNSAADKLENFYAAQAKDYDRFRERLLPGREALIQKLIPENFNGVWCDFGAGTGRNLEYALPRIGPRAKVFLVDICSSLLTLAHERVERLKLKNVEVINADVCTFNPGGIEVDRISFSYSLSMIPPWKAALMNAEQLLKDGGEIGVVDFCDRSCEVGGEDTISARFWRKWFSIDGVYLNHRHQEELSSLFAKKELISWRHALPIVPFLKPWRYLFIGKK